jgi:hypothetical protein
MFAASRERRVIAHKDHVIAFEKEDRLETGHGFEKEGFATRNTSPGKLPARSDPRHQLLDRRASEMASNRIALRDQINKLKVSHARTAKRTTVEQRPHQQTRR